MSETAPTYEPQGQPVAAEPSPQTPKSGRGPTRPAILAADLIESIEKAGPSGASRFRAAVADGCTAKSLTVVIREAKRALAAHVKEMEADIADDVQLAEWLAEAERLPEVMRGFVAAALEPVAAQGEPAADDGKEGPAV